MLQHAFHKYRELEITGTVSIYHPTFDRIHENLYGR